MYHSLGHTFNHLIQAILVLTKINMCICLLRTVLLSFSETVISPSSDVQFKSILPCWKARRIIYNVKLTSYFNPYSISSRFRSKQTWPDFQDCSGSPTATHISFSTGLGFRFRKFPLKLGIHGYHYPKFQL